MTTNQVTQNINFQVLLWAVAWLAVATLGLWLVLRWAALPAVGFIVVAMIPPVFWLCLAGLTIGAYVTYPRR